MNEELQEYMALKSGIKAAQARIDELAPIIKEFVEETNPEDKIIDIEGYGVFSIEKKTRHNFEGTDVAELEERLVLRQNELIARGDVPVEVTEFLKFTPVLRKKSD